MITAGPFTQADGPQTINLGAETHLPWHEIAIAITDTGGVPTPPTVAAKMAGEAIGVGTYQSEIFTDVLDIGANERRWKPFFSFIKEIVLTPTDLDAGLQYTVTIVSSKG